MYSGFRNERPKRRDIIHDKAQFIEKIMQRACVLDNNKMNWKWGYIR